VGIVSIMVKDGYLGLLEEGNHQVKEEDYLLPFER
jgi:hypothetical protein